MYTDRLDIVYTIEDEWGNTSEGVLTPTLVPTVFPPANVIYLDGKIIVGSNIVVPLNTRLQGTVLRSANGLASVRVGDSVIRRCSTPWRRQLGHRY